MSFITVDEGKNMIVAFKSERTEMLKPEYGADTLPLCITYDKSEFEQLMAQEGCEQVRIFLGLDDAGLVQAVIVGVDAEGNDIINENDPKILDRGVRCPEMCPSNSAINPAT